MLRGPTVHKGLSKKDGPSKTKSLPQPQTSQLNMTKWNLREVGKCFHCKIAWEVGHYCQGKGQVHYVEVCYDIKLEDSDLNFGVDILDQVASKVEGILGSMVTSLHEVKKYLILKVVGQACRQDMMLLIEPKAYHNFIDEGFVEKKALCTKGFEGFKFFNINGKFTLVDHIMERFKITLQSYMVREHLYIYPLKVHPHIILGVQWLFELGDIHTNYQKLTMSFEIDGKTHTLQGYEMSIYMWIMKI